MTTTRMLSQMLLLLLLLGVAGIASDVDATPIVGNDVRFYWSRSFRWIQRYQLHAFHHYFALRFSSITSTNHKHVFQNDFFSAALACMHKIDPAVSWYVQQTDVSKSLPFVRLFFASLFCATLLIQCSEGFAYAEVTRLSATTYEAYIHFFPKRDNKIIGINGSAVCRSKLKSRMKIIMTALTMAIGGRFGQ